MEEDIKIMEEDIKIIEEMIEVYRSCSVDEEGFDMKVDIGFMKKECEALENLLTRYKQLEEENENLKNDLQHDGLAHKYLTLKATSIPKSKVKEKIEEYKKNIDIAQGEELLMLDSKVDVLEELLREEREDV